MREIKEIVEQAFRDNVDGITFIPATCIDDLDIRGFSYNKKIKYETGPPGHVYHILLYKIDPDGTVLELDYFDSILTGPEVYVYNIIKSGFFGMVTKKTKGRHSKNFVKLLVDKLKVHMV